MFCAIWDNGDQPLVIGIEYNICGCASKQCDSYRKGQLIDGDLNLLCSEKIFEIDHPYAIVVNSDFPHKCPYHSEIANQAWQPT